MFFDCWQIRSQLVSGAQNAQGARRKFPNQTLFVGHLALPIVLRQYFSNSTVAVKEAAVWDLLRGRKQNYFLCSECWEPGKTYSTQTLHFNGVINQTVNLLIDCIDVVVDVRIHLSAEQDERQLAATNAGTTGVTGENFSTHLQIRQRNCLRIECTDAQLVGGVLENLIEQPNEGERRNWRRKQLDAQLVGNDVRHALQVTGCTTTLEKRKVKF